ncbi:hypothetical protein MAR_009668 [Mya arenaria]|uniref:Uncharacterized protein n=1 Tax=Mya arenaria TaxID=6604 RepID=A0ABY7DZE7_MYAAR|nr:hypothetical protein MAR_009668 [Mya arenaria]
MKYFFHYIFHGYAHKCFLAFRLSRFKGYETISTENLHKIVRAPDESIKFCLDLHNFLYGGSDKFT